MYSIFYSLEQFFQTYAAVTKMCQLYFLSLGMKSISERFAGDVRTDSLEIPVIKFAVIKI